MLSLDMVMMMRLLEVGNHETAIFTCHAFHLQVQLGWGLADDMGDHRQIGVIGPVATRLVDDQIVTLALTVLALGALHLSDRLSGRHGGLRLSRHYLLGLLWEELLVVVKERVSAISGDAHLLL